MSLPVRKGDTSRKLYINLTDSGIPYFIEDGCRAVFSAKKADDNAILNDCVIEKNTTIRYDFSPQTTSSSGVVDCEIRLYGTEGNLITSPRFILVVDERVVYDSDFPLSESEKSAIDNILLSETARVEAEEDRAKNEVARQEKEEERKSRFDSFLESSGAEIEEAINNGKAEVENVVDSANAVLASAETSLKIAQDAVDEANEAVERANEAASVTVSPIVEVSEIEGGHRITITDKDGTKTFDVMNGKNGQDGEDGEDGESAKTLIATGSYVGAGKNLSLGTAKTLTFDFTPKIVVVQGIPATGIFLYGSTQTPIIINATSMATDLAWTETSLTMSGKTDGVTFNQANLNYRYFLIG